MRVGADGELRRRGLDVVAVFAQSPEAGGGFHQSLNSLATLAAACENHHRLRAVVLKGGLPDPERLCGMLPALSSVEWVAAPPSQKPRLLSSIPRRFRRARIVRALARATSGLTTGSFLDGLGADVVYFLSPNSAAMQLRRTPFILTVWDVCHLDFPEFPEVRADGEFERRESLFARALPQALLVVTDSEALSDRIHARYGVDRSRLLAQPFLPSPFLFSDASPTDEVLEHYTLQSGYWVYPAQFWAHKNHVRILEALSLVRSRGERHRVVFMGSDKGFRATVEAHVRRLDLADDVTFLGFVPSEHLRGLYEGSVGLVFPSYFGPTNLPPLEALALGVPVVCSDFHERSLGEGPYYFDPDDAGDLAAQMIAAAGRASHERRGVSAAREHAAWREGEPRASVAALRDHLELIAARVTMLLKP